jgi:hypothetical protein
MAVRKERSFELTFPSDEVYNGARRVLRNLEFNITLDDPRLGRLEANNSTRLNAGYRVEVRVQSIEARRTALDISSETVNKTAIFDLGDNERNLDKVESFLRDYLGAGLSATQGEQENLDLTRRRERQELHRFIVDHFDEKEMRTLRFYLGINANDVDGDNGAELAIHLIEYMERKEDISALRVALRQARPQKYGEIFGLSSPG